MGWAGHETVPATGYTGRTPGAVGLRRFHFGIYAVKYFLFKIYKQINTIDERVLSSQWG